MQFHRINNGGVFVNKKLTIAFITGAVGASVGAIFYFVSKKKEEELISSIKYNSVTGLLTPLLGCDDKTAMKIQRQFFIITGSDIDKVIRIHKSETEDKVKVRADGFVYIVYITKKYRISKIEKLNPDDESVICTTEL